MSKNACPRSVVLSIRIPADLAEDLVSVGAPDPVHRWVYHRADPSTPLPRLLKRFLLTCLSSLVDRRMESNSTSIGMDAVQLGERELLATKRQSPDYPLDITWQDYVGGVGGPEESDAPLS